MSTEVEPLPNAVASVTRHLPKALSPNNRQFCIVFLTGASALLAARALSPLQESMKAALAFTDTQFALLQGPAMAIPIVVLGVPLGLLIDRYSRVRLLLVFLLCELLGSLLTAYAPSFATLFLARALVGLTATATLITGFSLVSDLYPPDQRGRAKALLALGQFGGTSLAFALGGSLLALFNNEDGWRWAMAWLTGPILLAVATLTLTMREPPRIGIEIQKPSLKDSLFELKRHRAVVVALILGIVFAEIPVAAMLAWGAPTFSRTFALTPAQVGSIMAVTTMAGGLLGPIAGGVLADRCQRAGGPRRTVSLLICLALVGALSSSFAIIPDVELAAIIFVVLLASVGATLSVGITLFTIVIPNELRGLCIAISSVANALFALAVAPVIVSALSDILGGPAMIGKSLTVICTVACTCFALTFAASRRWFPFIPAGPSPDV